MIETELNIVDVSMIVIAVRFPLKLFLLQQVRHERISVAPRKFAKHELDRELSSSRAVHLVKSEGDTVWI